jgi:hypothetical protein
MKPVSPVPELKEFELIIAENQPEYEKLPALLGYFSYKPVLTRWEFTPEERAAIANGADLYMTQLTFGKEFAPVLLEVDKKIDPEQFKKDFNLKSYRILYVTNQDQKPGDVPFIMVDDQVYTYEQFYSLPELAGPRHYLETYLGQKLKTPEEAAANYKAAAEAAAAQNEAIQAAQAAPEQQLNVHQVIRLLDAHPPEALVFAEMGKVGMITKTENGSVLLRATMDEETKESVVQVM